MERNIKSPSFYHYSSSSEEGSSHSGNGNVKDEVKFIVFLNRLLLLFHICPYCKSDGLLVDWKLVGTMLEVKATCSNIRCKGRTFVWKSQPEMPGTMMPAGNFLLSFAILVSGSSATKVVNLFRHMGLACISLPTYYRHQSVRELYN